MHTYASQCLFATLKQVARALLGENTQFGAARSRSGQGVQGLSLRLGLALQHAQFLAGMLEESLGFLALILCFSQTWKLGQWMIGVFEDNLKPTVLFTFVILYCENGRT